MLESSTSMPRNKANYTALAAHSENLPVLIRANLGHQLASAANPARMGPLEAQAPPLENDKLAQAAAPPLGSRVRVDPAAVSDTHKTKSK
jgi:hypothetical protein